MSEFVCAVVGIGIVALIVWEQRRVNDRMRRQEAQGRARREAERMDADAAHRQYMADLRSQLDDEDRRLRQEATQARYEMNLRVDRALRETTRSGSPYWDRGERR